MCRRNSAAVAGVLLSLAACVTGTSLPPEAAPPPRTADASGTAAERGRPDRDEPRAEMRELQAAVRDLRAEVRRLHDEVERLPRGPVRPAAGGGRRVPPPWPGGRPFGPADRPARTWEAPGRGREAPPLARPPGGRLLDRLLAPRDDGRKPCAECRRMLQKIQADCDTCRRKGERNAGRNED